MSEQAALVFLMGRAVFVLVFLISGLTFHLPKSSMAVGYARQIRFPLAILAGWPVGVWLLAGALSVALGAWGDIGALMLAVFVILAGGWFHQFWKVEDEQQKMFQMQLFWRNVSFLGASLALFAVFASVGHGLAFTITDPFLDLR